MRYLVVDTETGGLDSQKNALMSLGAILLDDELNELSYHYMLFQNELKREVSIRAKEVNGLNEERLEKALPPSAFVPVWNILHDSADVLIGHNVAFDIGFMLENGFKCDPSRTLDTMHLSWDTWAGEKASLSKCYKRIGGNPRSAHNALYDCQMVVRLLRWFVESGNLHLPLPYYPAVPDYYERGAFGYIKMKEMDLI